MQGVDADRVKVEGNRWVWNFLKLLEPRGGNDMNSAFDGLRRRRFEIILQETLGDHIEKMINGAGETVWGGGSIIGCRKRIGYDQPKIPLCVNRVEKCKE